MHWFKNMKSLGEYILLDTCRTWNLFKEYYFHNYISLSSHTSLQNCDPFHHHGPHLSLKTQIYFLQRELGLAFVDKRKIMCFSLWIARGVFMGNTRLKVMQFSFIVLKYNELSQYPSEYALFWDRIRKCIRPNSSGFVSLYSGLFISLNLLGCWPSCWCSFTVSVCGGAWSLSSGRWQDDVSFNASVTITNLVLEGRSRSVNTISTI